jgi:hypothetical protein
MLVLLARHAACMTNRLTINVAAGSFPYCYWPIIWQASRHRAGCSHSTVNGGNH